MTDKATLLALADKLEKATGPSRHLDALIHTAVTGKDVIYDGGERPHSAVIVGTETWTNRDGSENATVEGYAPAYTANTDDALTLRPPGWLLTGLSDGILDPKYRDVRSLTKWLTGMAREGAVVNGPEDVGEMVSSMGATPAISVAAAALRARAA